MEFALVVPILVMLLLGTITAGLAYSRANGVTNAVREGARFGATADASPTLAAQWATEVVQRVRQTQFDDAGQRTTVCVQLYKVGTGVIANTTTCSRPAGAPALTLPASSTAAPAVPSGGLGSCVVRVIASRPITINIGVSSWDTNYVSSSVARYERKDKVPACL